MRTIHLVVVEIHLWFEQLLPLRIAVVRFIAPKTTLASLSTGSSARLRSSEPLTASSNAHGFSKERRGGNNFLLFRTFFARFNRWRLLLCYPWKLRTKTDSIRGEFPRDKKGKIHVDFHVETIHVHFIFIVRCMHDVKLKSMPRILLFDSILLFSFHFFCFPVKDGGQFSNRFRASISQFEKWMKTNKK